MLHMAMKDRWVQAEVNDHRAAPVAEPAGHDPQVSGADHAFARHGGRSKPEADRALALSVDFFKRYL